MFSLQQTDYTRSVLKKISFREESAFERTKKFISEIGKKDGKIGAFIEVYEKDALEQARAVDKKLSSGKKLGVLGGLVIAVKNSVAIKGKRFTCSSKMLENYVSPYNATAIERIIAEDGIILGSTNLDEFCCGSDCSNSALKLTRNPIDLERVPGGSSGGNAAAVAAGFCDLTLSEDTGGSIRCPASFCGVAGIKPTYGTISRYGVSDMAMSFDQLGPISKDVLGSALLLQAISGGDEKDNTTTGVKKQDFVSTLEEFPKKLKVGVPKEFFAGCDEQVAELVWRKITKLEEKHEGVQVKEFSFPLVKYALPVYYLLVFSEFASAMQKFDGLKYGLKWGEGRDLNEVISSVRDKGFGREVKRRILLGTYITMKEFREAWYTKALKARDALKNEFAKIFKQFDVLLGPTMPMVAWKIGEKSEDPLKMYLADVLTVPANCAGIPAASVPAGENSDGLPAGIQVMAGWESDLLALKIMRALEKN